MHVIGKEKILDTLRHEGLVFKTDYISQEVFCQLHPDWAKPMVNMVDMGVTNCKVAPNFSYEAVLDVNQMVEIAYEAYRLTTLVFPELNQGMCDFFHRRENSIS
jgi:hypothetical protein